MTNTFKLNKELVEDLPSSLNNKIDLDLINSQYTTNRILEIPQDIKLELNSGTLTLKAGSKVYIPNGSGVFDTVTVASDVNCVVGGTFTNVLTFYNNSTNTYYSCIDTACYSGSSAPTSLTGNVFWYDITNNIIKRHNGNSWDNGGWSFTICNISITDNQVTSIDQVFNGFGYIGSTVFALTGLKVQIPNGRNNDGTCKTTIISNDMVKTVAAGGTYNYKYMLGATSLLAYTTSAVSYNDDLNYNVYTNGSKIIACEIANGLTTSDKISEFIPYSVDSIANSNMTNISSTGRSLVSKMSMPGNSINISIASSGSSYKAPANGYFSAAFTSSTNSRALIVLQNSTRYINSGDHAYTNPTAIFANVPVQTGDNVVLVYEGGNFTYFKFIYAEGEN